MVITYDVLAKLKVALDNNFNQKVRVKFAEDVGDCQSVIKVTLEDGFIMETRLGWYDRMEWSEDHIMLVLLLHFKKMYEDVYK